MFSVPPQGLSASGWSGMEDRQVAGPVASGHRTGPGWVTPACVPCSDPPHPGASRCVDHAPARRPTSLALQKLLASPSQFSCPHPPAPSATSLGSPPITPRRNVATSRLSGAPASDSLPRLHEADSHHKQLGNAARTEPGLL